MTVNFSWSSFVSKSIDFPTHFLLQPQRIHKRTFYDATVNLLKKYFKESKKREKKPQRNRIWITKERRSFWCFCSASVWPFRIDFMAFWEKQRVKKCKFSPQKDKMKHEKGSNFMPIKKSFTLACMNVIFFLKKKYRIFPINFTVKCNKIFVKKKETTAKTKEEGTAFYRTFFKISRLCVCGIVA